MWEQMLKASCALSRGKGWPGIFQWIVDTFQIEFPKDFILNKMLVIIL